jgi:hypothetical protein
MPTLIGSHLVGYGNQKDQLKFPHSPHLSWRFHTLPSQTIRWTTTEDGSTVHLEVIFDDIDRYLVYMSTSKTSTRSGRRFVRSDRINSAPLPFHASASWISDNHIHLHSWTCQYQVPENCTSMFWDTIQNDNNPSLWRNIHCDGDGKWIWQGLCSGTLLIIHDGSYMREVSPHICSAAIMIRCTASG